MVNIKGFLLLIFCCFFGSNITFAQKAKFKNLKATCQKTRLPSNYVQPENRTYDLYKKGSYSDNVEIYNKGIYGWKLDSESPKMEAVVSLYGFSITPAKKSSEKKQKKDKEGNVTDSWTEYTYSGSATGKGTLYVYGESNQFKYKKKYSEKSKAELKQEEAAEAKKKDLADNPFLSGADADTASDEGESDESVDAGLDDALLPLVKTISLNTATSVRTGEHRSSSAAYKDYRENEKPKLYGHRDKFPGQAYDKALNTLNQQYGYSPVNYSVWLRKMKSQKHPEYKMWNDACQAAQTLLKSFKYNKSIASSQAKFDPIVDYFTKKVEAISDKDRKAKKMKKAAFENLINIMYNLDRHEELVNVCQKYIDSKLLDKMAKRMINKADRQIALMAFHKVESCHLEEMSDIEEGDIETEETEAAEEEEGNN